MEIRIDERWKEWAPELQIGSLVADVVVGESHAELNGELDALIAEIEGTLPVAKIAKEEAIAAMRKAYRTVGKDPTKYRVSSEALLRRIGRGLGLYRVNNVVEINNYISMKSRCPVCAYDISKLEGDVTFTVAPAGTVYEGIGRGELNIEFLPVFSDEKGPFGSLTSDSSRTCIGNNTRRMVLNLVSVHPHENMELWLGEVERLLVQYAQGKNIEKRIWQGEWKTL